MGSAIDGLAGNDQLARNRLVAGLDPQLPVGILVAEGKVLAFDAADHATADMFGLQHAGDQGLIDVGQEQVGAGENEALAGTQDIDQRIDGLWPLELGVEVAPASMATPAIRVAFIVVLSMGLTSFRKGLEGPRMARWPFALGQEGRSALPGPRHY